jgi:DnaJ homolog subfamily C member 7
LILKLQIKSNKAKEEAAAVFKEGKYEEAITKFEEVMQLDPMNGNFNSTLLLNIAIGQVKLGNNEKALVALNKAIKMNKKYAKALVKRGEVNMALGEYNDAIRDFSEASEHDSNGFGVQQKLKDAQAKAKASKKKDYYKILGVEKNATDAEIRKAYKKAALKWHPDKNQNGTEEVVKKADKMFKDVNESMAVLGDRDKREKYDQGFDLEDINSGKADHGMGGGFGGMDPNDLFSMFMGSQMGGMGGHPGMGRGRTGGMGGHGMGGGHPGFTFKFG